MNDVVGDINLPDTALTFLYHETKAEVGGKEKLWSDSDCKWSHLPSAEVQTEESVGC